MGTFENFSRANRKRCEAPHGFNHPLGQWSMSDWMTAVVGEVGEAANCVKKLNRLRDGIPNKKGETEDQLHAMLRDELADAFTYLDLLAQALGFDLLAAAERKFEKVSREIGYDPIRPFEPGPVPDLSGMHEHKHGDGRRYKGEPVFAIPPSTPMRPSKGDRWTDTKNEKEWEHDGEKWVAIPRVQTRFAKKPQTGDRYIDNTTGREMEFDGYSWLDVTPPSLAKQIADDMAAGTATFVPPSNSGPATLAEYEGGGGGSGGGGATASWTDSSPASAPAATDSGSSGSDGGGSSGGGTD